MKDLSKLSREDKIEVCLTNNAVLIYPYHCPIYQDDILRYSGHYMAFWMF